MAFSDLAGAAGTIAGALQSPPKQKPKGFTGLISTPAFTLAGGNLLRKNDDFLGGMRRMRDLYASQREQVRPGFGRLTEAGVSAIRAAAAQRAGSLRSQLVRRGLAGASFAEDTLARQQLGAEEEERNFRTQAFLAEQQATNELLDREFASLSAQAAQELAELGVATNFLSSVSQAAQTSKTIATAIQQMQLLEEFNATPSGSNA